MTVARKITSKFEMECRGCDELILQGDPVFWVKGLSQPAAWHEKHGTEIPAPPVRSSIGQGKPKEAVPAPASAQDATQPASVPSNAGIPPEELRFVQIAAWIPVENVLLVVEAMKQARRKMLP